MKKLFAAVLFILTMSISLPAEAVEVRHELDYGWKFQRVSPDVMDKDNVFICFDGLDVIADVTLNGEQIITADNMFRQWRTDIKDLLKSEGNVIEVYFHSITRKGLELADASPYWFGAGKFISNGISGKHRKTFWGDPSGGCICQVHIH